MFTTGSKFFLGAAFVAGFAAFVQGVAVSDPAGMLVLIGVAVIAVFLGGVMVASRDAHAGVPAGGAASVPGVPHTGPSIWPVAGGLGTALAALGIVVDRRLAGAGVIVLLATVIEWMIQSWSDRSSADTGFNARMRGRVAHPLEFPIFAAILGVGVIYMFSRIMVSLGEKPATVVFSVAGVVVLLAAITIWKLDRLSPRAVGGIVALGTDGNDGKRTVESE